MWRMATTPGFGVGRHRDPAGRRATDDTYIGRHRATPPPAPRPVMGQPRPGDTPQLVPRSPKGSDVRRHGAGRQTGKPSEGTLGTTGRHRRTVKAQTQRDREFRRSKQRQASGAVGLLRRIWDLGYR